MCFRSFTRSPSYSTTTTTTTTTKYQFIHRPTRPKLTTTPSNQLDFLPPAKFTLSIISLSYNRPNVHALLSQNFPASRSIRHIDPNQLFILTAIPARFVNLNQPIPSHIHTLSSCFSQLDQQRWKERRIQKRHSKTKPTHQLRLTFSLRIKELHKSAVIRKSIRKRWIAALKLIVQYGADSSSSLTETTAADQKSSAEGEQEATQEETLRIDPTQAGFHRWLNPDHYYIVHPTLALNTVGLPQLIRAIRDALHAINRIPNRLPGPASHTSSSRTHPSRNPLLKTTDLASSNPHSRSGATTQQDSPPSTQANPIIIIKPDSHSLSSESSTPLRRIPAQFISPQQIHSTPASLHKPPNTSAGPSSDHQPSSSPPRRRLPPSRPNFIPPPPTQSTPASVKPAHLSVITITNPGYHSQKRSLEPPRKSRPYFIPPQHIQSSTPAALHKPPNSLARQSGSDHLSSHSPPTRLPSRPPQLAAQSAPSASLILPAHHILSTNQPSLPPPRRLTIPLKK